MIFLIPFAVAFVGITLTGVIAYLIFKYFASTRAARIAAFWLTVGAAAGRYSYSGLFYDAAAACSAFLGAAVATLILWRWLLKPLVGEVTGGDN